MRHFGIGINYVRRSFFTRSNRLSGAHMGGQHSMLNTAIIWPSIYLLPTSPLSAPAVPKRPRPQWRWAPSFSDVQGAMPDYYGKRGRLPETFLTQAGARARMSEHLKRPFVPSATVYRRAAGREMRSRDLVSIIVCPDHRARTDLPSSRRRRRGGL